MDQVGLAAVTLAVPCFWRRMEGILRFRISRWINYFTKYFKPLSSTIGFQVHADWCYKHGKRIRCTRKFYIHVFQPISVPYEILRPPRGIRPGVRGEAVDPGQHGGHPGQQRGPSSLILSNLKCSIDIGSVFSEIYSFLSRAVCCLDSVEAVLEAV